MSTKYRIDLRLKSVYGYTSDYICWWQKPYRMIFRKFPYENDTIPIHKKDIQEYLDNRECGLVEKTTIS